ncbi:MAG TPA: inositol monophosphatase family protein [Terriglobales bacterium]|jgi:myo-inositol-1(or 4)-monophosphatase|nr:inositol monophosphatase family protein [Terriglobales bacterium]
MNEYLKVAIEAAREAGAVLRAEFYRPKQISYKGEVDIVTESDRRSEALIVARLREQFPSHAIIAEEGGGAAAAGAKYCWHVDPLDGTTNFAHGYPCFAVSIGIVEDGEPLAGVVFNPVSEELFTAMRGEGAYLNEERIRVSPVETLAQSLVATGFPTHHRKRSANINYYWEFTLRSHGVRRDGSAALDLCSVAAGRFDAFWEFNLHSWDTAAGILLVQEAGGIVTDFAGKPYRPGGHDMLASNGRIHREMQEVAAGIAARAAMDA